MQNLRDQVASIETVQDALDVIERLAGFRVIELHELKLTASRKAGELLRSIKQHQGGLSLASLGVTRNQSSQWQKLAKLTDDEFHEYLCEQRAAGKWVSQSDVVDDGEDGHRIIGEALAGIARLKVSRSPENCEASLKASWKAGKVLRSMQLHCCRGSRLAKLGIRGSQSWNWQQIAKVSAEQLESYLQDQRSSGKRVSGKGLLRFVAGQGRTQGDNRPPGLFCPYCGSRYNTCIAHLGTPVNVTRRNRRCRECDEQYQTIEVVYDPEEPIRSRQVRFATARK